MDHIHIACPHCGFSKDVARSQIPANLKRITCPNCKDSFRLEQGTQAAEPPRPAEAPSPSDPVVPAASTPQGIIPGIVREEAATPPAPQTETPAPPAPPAPPVIASQPAGDQQPRYLPFTFTGTAREYFGIWIVNTLLKIVTLGLYSPWAKVRKRKFFYGNTLLEDANFDYLANPLALLKGWLIGAAFFILYTLSQQFSPLIGMVFGLLFFLLIPWVIVRSRIYNNRNSAHRNLRFNFKPAYAESYKVFAGLPLLTTLTLGLLGPYVFYRQKRFLMENNSYGQTAFGFDARVKDFYILALKVIGIVVLCFGGFFTFTTMYAAGISPNGKAVTSSIVILAPLLMAGAYFLLIVYSYVRFANLTWNSTHLGRNRFISSMRVRDMSWIMLSNLVASVLSFGLLVPWAAVRLARYRLNSLTLETYGDLDHYLGAKVEETSAIGEEIGDIFDVDFGL